MKKTLHSGYKMILTRLSSFEKAPFYKNLMIHPKNNLVYLRVPKAGCSTIISRLLEISDLESVANLHSENELITYERSEFGDRISRLSRSEAKLFAVVRNPYTRVLSAYFEKIARESDGMRYRSELGLAHDVDVSFDEFVDALIQQNPLALDMHFMPQSLILRKHRVRYDAIFHLENMQECLRWLDTLLPESAKKNPVTIAHHATNANARAESTYNSVNEAKIMNYYAEDFEMFGYHKTVEKLNYFEDIALTGETSISDMDMGLFLKLDNKLRAKLPMLMDRHPET